MAKAKELGDDDRLIFRVNWATWLDTDTIVTSAWVVPSELTDLGTFASTTDTTIKLAHGTGIVIGQTYEVTNVITTVTTDEDREFTFKVKAVEKKYK